MRSFEGLRVPQCGRKVEKIVKNRRNEEFFAKYLTLTLKKSSKMNFRVIVAMLHPKSTTSGRDTEKIKKIVGGTGATLKNAHILLRYLKIPRVHDFSHFLRKNVEIFLFNRNFSQQILLI